MDQIEEVMNLFLMRESVECDISHLIVHDGKNFIRFFWFKPILFSTDSTPNKCPAIFGNFFGNEVYAVNLLQHLKVTFY